MSVRVNLLPEEVRARGRASRARLGLGVVGLVFLLLLGGLWFLQQGQIDDARERLAAAETRNAQLQADLAALQPFADLEARVADSAGVLTSALGEEASAAGVLQDLSLVFPPTAELQSLSLTFTPEPQTPAPGGERLTYGTLTASGRTVVGVSPGVERVLIDISRAAMFENAYVSATTVDEDGVAQFALDVQLGPEVRTGRYVFDGSEVAP